jgi:hypothetical protein
MIIHCDVCEYEMEDHESIYIMKIRKRLFCGHLSCILKVKKKLNPKNTEPMEWDWVEGTPKGEK